MVVGLSLGAGFGLMVLAVMIRFSGYLMNGGGLMIQGRYLMEGLIDGNGVARTVQGRGVVEDACRLDEEVSMSRLWVVESAKGCVAALAKGTMVAGTVVVCMGAAIWCKGGAREGVGCSPDWALGIKY
ncbi:hypothetical protein V6N13_130712 [Hibiscus sabdariffa]